MPTTTRWVPTTQSASGARWPNVRTPLQASKAYIIYGIMAPDGSIHSYNVEVGTSVTLNWKEGLIF